MRFKVGERSLSSAAILAFFVPATHTEIEEREIERDRERQRETEREIGRQIERETRCLSVSDRVNTVKPLNFQYQSPSF